MSVEIKAMEAGDVDAALRICNLAFGTFVGHPQPEQFFGDKNYIRTRFGAPNTRAFVAVDGGELIGSNFATRWGSLGFFGPLTIHPKAWDRGFGRDLVGAVMDAFSAWGCTHRALFTFPHSAKHIGLYRKFGFYPRYLTAVVSKPVESTAAETPMQWSTLSDEERLAARASIDDLTDTLLPGLSLADEIDTVLAKGFGDTLLVGTPDAVDAFMVCHTGAGTEAGVGQCFGKFGAVRRGTDRAELFSKLVQAVEDFAASQDLEYLTLGVNTARRGAYEWLLDNGYKPEMYGIAMQSGNDLGTCTEEHFVIDDWR